MDRLSRLCMEAVAAGIQPRSGLVFLAKERLRRESEARKRRLANSRPRRRREAVKEAAEREMSLDMWWDVLERAAGCCELCDKPGDILQKHHLLGGYGRRRQKESIENTMATHVACHDAYHRRPWDYRHVVRAWASKYGYPIPNRKEYRT